MWYIYLHLPLKKCNRPMDPMGNSTATKIIKNIPSKSHSWSHPLRATGEERSHGFRSKPGQCKICHRGGNRPKKNGGVRVIVGSLWEISLIFPRLKKSPEQIWVENNETLMKQQLNNPWLVTSACPKRGTMTLEKACQCLGFLLQLPRKECTRVAPGIQSWYCLMPKGVIPSNRWCTWNPNFRVA